MRYEVWSFTQPKARICYAKDNGFSQDMFSVAISHNQYKSIIKYGEKEGSYEHKSVALKNASDLFFRNKNIEIFIWDSKNEEWID